MNKKLAVHIIFILIGMCNIFSQSKVVGLMAVRNEQHIIAQTLRALALYTDAIVILDDASQDDTLSIIKSLQQICNIERIIEKETWFRDESGDRNRLLQAGREIQGTHFIVLDGDEIFTSNLLENNLLRNRILALNPGDSLSLQWIQLWRNTKAYRCDKSIWSGQWGTCIFCDDDKCYYDEVFLHASRIPNHCKGEQKTVSEKCYGVMHFQFVNWHNLLVKQAWYRCLEHIRNPQKSIAAINKLYHPSKHEEGLALKVCPNEWFASYYFFDHAIYTIEEQHRKYEVLQWLQQHGKDFFRDLDIWDIDWKQPILKKEKVKKLRQRITPCRICVQSKPSVFRKNI